MPILLVPKTHARLANQALILVQLDLLHVSNANPEHLQEIVVRYHVINAKLAQALQKLASPSVAPRVKRDFTHPQMVLPFATHAQKEPSPILCIQQRALAVPLARTMTKPMQRAF